MEHVIGVLVLFVLPFAIAEWHRLVDKHTSLNDGDYPERWIILRRQHDPMSWPWWKRSPEDVWELSNEREGYRDG